MKKKYKADVVVWHWVEEKAHIQIEVDEKDWEGIKEEHTDGKELAKVLRANGLNWERLQYNSSQDVDSLQVSVIREI